MNNLQEITSSVVVAAKGGPSVVRVVDAAPRSRHDIGLGVSFGATGRTLAFTDRDPKLQLRVDLEPLTTQFVGFAGGRLAGVLGVMALGEMSFDTDSNNEAGGQLRVGYRLALDVWRLSFALGIEVGPGFLSQLDFGMRATGLTFNFAPRFLVKARLAQGLSIFATTDFTMTGLEYGETAATARFQFFGFVSGAAGLMAHF
jgi:hypothetical protein